MINIVTRKHFSTEPRDVTSLFTLHIIKYTKNYYSHTQPLTNLWNPHTFATEAGIVVHWGGNRSNQYVRPKEILHCCGLTLILFELRFINNLFVECVCFKALRILVVHWTQQTQTYNTQLK